MKRTRLAFAILLACLALVAPAFAQKEAAGQAGTIEVSGTSDSSRLVFEEKTGLIIATNGMVARFGHAVLTARAGTVNQETGDVTAHGDVTLQRGEQFWRAESLGYNFFSGKMDSEKFRTGKQPFFAAGELLHGDTSNHVYVASDGLITTDDVANPDYKILAKRLKIVPGEYIEAEEAVMYVGRTPVMYFPHYRRSLKRHPNNFEFTPGYRSLYGPFLLGTYNSYWNDQFDSALHLDYRQRRGFGAGPDFNYELGPWGIGSFRGYYLHDDSPNLSATTNTAPVKSDRFRVSFTYDGQWTTNLSAKVVVRDQSDPFVIRDFFESEYLKNNQPSSFLEINHLWPNFSLDLLAEPQINDFFQTVERLPDLKLSAIRQQLGDTPLYYEGESSVGYFRFQSALPNGTNYSAMRADTFHQVLLPETFFGWLNVTPRVGGRFTHYGSEDGTGLSTADQNRGVFNTGAEVSFKLSRLWTDVQSKFWDVDGLRHVLEPSFNYVYVPSPSHAPAELPQFDTELSSLRLLPIDYPDYNSIDSIDTQNVLRLGVRNRLQTKRGGNVESVLSWAVYTDWRLDPQPGQSRFSEVYSDLTARPARWLLLTSQTRFDVDSGRWMEADHGFTIQPTNTWSWSLAHRFLRNDPTLGPDSGNNLITSRLHYRVNENWGFRVAHQFEAMDGRMEEQAYTIYRDLRSWTAALTFRVRSNLGMADDYTVAVTFSLKAFPRFKLNHDSDTPGLLTGG